MGEDLNSREKFLSIMKMEKGKYTGAKIPKVEIGYWAGTIRKWISEGLTSIDPVPGDIPDGVAIMANKNIYGKMEKTGDKNIKPVFSLDDNLTKFPVDYSPMFEKKVIEKSNGYIIYKDSYGVTNKSDLGMTTLPMELDYPVKDREDWIEYKEYYRADTIEKRLPPDWNSLADRLKNRDFPIRLGGTNGGFLGFPRQIMGLTNYMIKLHDDPWLIHDICETFLEFLILYYERIIRDVKVDCILIWEDMAGKGGSLISPSHFREFLTPRYKKMVRFSREMGIDIVLTDSDGYVEKLIPLIIETGVTGMYPFERAAGNDLLSIRKDFPDFQMIGGIDKRILFKSSGKYKIYT
jgi:uroporphyrinogen decarboxylase